MSAKLFRLLGVGSTLALALFATAPQAAEPVCKVKPFAGGVFNSPLEESRITFSSDGNTAYFGRSESFGPAAKTTIYVAQRMEGKWGEPAVAPFSGTFSDLDPYPTKDGKRVYFSSNRPTQGTDPKDIDIWYVEWAGQAWGEAVNVATVNKPADDLFPTIGPKGSLLFASDRTTPGKNYDIFEAEMGGAGFGPATALNDRINTKPTWEFNPLVVPVSRAGQAKQNMLLFVALNRKGGRGLGDLFITPYASKLPLQPEPIRSAINTAADEYHPSITPDGKTLVFVRRGKGKTANGDFMEATWPACAFGMGLQ